MEVLPMHALKQIWSYAISDGVPIRSLVIALVVGTIINLINQGHAMVAGLPVDIAKLLATYGRRRRRLRLKSAYGPKASRTSW
jgi:hypothetical protein